jgi:hypothetical protein
VLDAFAKLRKASISFVLSVCLSAWSISAPTGRIFIELDIWVFFEKKVVEKVQVSLKFGNNNGYFTWRPIYIFDYISFSSSYNEKYFRQMLQRN